ncbi:hypothetical protein BDFB_009566, partial [Asbolus verrucosus]
PRKLKLDRTLAKYKLHKSLPVSPVSEERRFADFVQERANAARDGRKSFSYFIDLGERCDTSEGFRQICSDIEKFSEDFNRKYEQIGRSFESRDGFKQPKHEPQEEEGNFSSDSLEEYSFRSVGNKKSNNSVPPRRCVSSNELCKYQDDDLCADEIPKSESFYLNPNIRSSQDSILSDDNLLEYDPSQGQMKSYCNSMESVLSNDSDCKSAPLEALFAPQKKLLAPKPAVGHSQSLPKNLGSAPPSPRRAQMKTSQTQTDFATPQELVAKKSNASAEFQEKLLRFETNIARNELKKPVAFFVETKNVRNRETEEEKKKPVLTMKNIKTEMYIPSLETKNKQYKSKFCNVLNNKPEFNIEIFESGHKGYSSATLKFEKNTNKQVQETSSLDRHLFTKSLLSSEKICHKPPKAVRRHSSKTRKTKTSYEYIKKEDYYNIKSNKKKDALNNRNVTDENTIELSYKEKNVEKDLETSNNGHSPNNNILNELYDSLDKSSMFSPKIDNDSLELNLNVENNDQKIYDSLDSVNLWSENCTAKFDNKKRTNSDYDGIQFALENIKILHEIQRKIHKINSLVDIFKKNMCGGKVRALSSMYESMTSSQSYYNDLTKLQATPIKFRRRNLSLPSFVERRLNYDPKGKVKNVNKDGGAEVYLDESSPDSSLRRSCSLSDLSMQKPVVSKSKIEQVSGKKAPTSASRSGSRYAKNNAMMMTRSRSSGVLNQSDSENEADKKMSRLMRPTISSHNKINKTLQSRKKQSYSTSNLNTVGVDNVSTSEEEIEMPPAKPAVPPRSRASYDGTPTATPRRHLNNKDKS